MAQPSPPSGPAREIAPIEVTGNWVSVLTEDYRWRVVVPPKGDYTSIPLNEAGRREADTWNPEQDRANGDQCKAYGAANIMRIPGRVRISWEGDETLVIETDKGMQRRELHFSDGAMPGEPALQGFSQANWERSISSRGFFPANYLTHLQVVTTELTPGYLRLNGVPYSENAIITEHFTLSEGFGGEWLTITTIVEDPQFLTEPFVTSTDFRREANDELWNPEPCMSAWGPLRERKAGSNSIRL
ncbi:MAG: hypothetical protein CMQ38_11985 [Gammaproteobacteria bacterium]|nr:hypothetical protein [Gammaproteobacteria bacterium]